MPGLVDSKTWCAYGEAAKGLELASAGCPWLQNWNGRWFGQEHPFPTEILWQRNYTDCTPRVGRLKFNSKLKTLSTLLILLFYDAINIDPIGEDQRKTPCMTRLNCRKRNKYRTWTWSPSSRRCIWDLLQLQHIFWINFVILPHLVMLSIWRDSKTAMAPNCSIRKK